MLTKIQNGRTFIILLSQVRNRRTIGEKVKHSKKSKKTTQWTTSAIRRILAELNNPSSPKLADKHVLSKMNLTSMEVSMF